MCTNFYLRPVYIEPKFSLLAHRKEQANRILKYFTELIMKTRLLNILEVVLIAHSVPFTMRRNCSSKSEAHSKLLGVTK